MCRFLASFLIATLAATETLAAGLCLAPSHPAGINGGVACDVDTTFVNDWIGYDTETAPCASGAGEYGCDYGDPPDAIAFCWAISNSALHPHFNVGPLGTGTTPLYLWLWNASMEGLATAEFYLAGDLNVVSVTSVNGFGVSHPGGDIREVRVTVAGCPWGPVVAARVDVEGRVGLEPPTWGVLKASYR